MGAPEAHRAEGLWSPGLDRQGHRVCALGRASRPEVVDRVFRGLAELFSIEAGSYLLVDAGPGQAWGELPAVALRRLGLGGLARRLERRLLARRWAGCLRAVARARSRASP